MLKLDQKSTKAGIALIGGAVAIATGNADVITVEISDNGVQIGGLAELAITAATGIFGAFLTLFNFDKDKGQAKS